jgi:ribulose 1,5-bisphosphate synthetase/thiazole synthase
MSSFLSRRKFLFSTVWGLIGLKNLLDKPTDRPSNGPIIIKKSPRELLTTDVLVVGGGPAGIGAAIAAARHGAQTVIIENYGFFGGVGAWGMGMEINQMRPGGKARSAIHEILIKKLQTYGDLAVRINDHQLLCNVEYLKVTILDVFDEAGCRYLVHSQAVDVLTDNECVTGVVVSTKSGLAEIHARVVIDCTGDADIAYFAGAETMTETGRLSPQTLLLNLINSRSKTIMDEDFEKIFRFAKAREKYRLIPSTWFMKQVSNSDFSFINHPGTKELGNFDITDPFQFSEAECQGRRQVIQMVQAMREFGDESLKDLQICGTGPQIGVRESRRVKGQYILTEEDAMKGACFDDVIAWRSGYLDIGWVRFSQMKVHQVPYRTIIPEKIEGLLTAGRCISATHEAASAGKSMGNCLATGHAAGIAAALAVAKNKQPRQLPVIEIQDALKKDGVDLSRGGEQQDEKMLD